MSLRAYADVWEHSKATHGSLLLMLAMADIVDRRSPWPVCWAGPTYLAKQARMSRDHIKDLLDGLVTMGELRKVAHRELDPFALQELEAATETRKIGNSTLYILCPGTPRRTLDRWEAALRGENFPPGEIPPGEIPRRGGGIGGENFPSLSGDPDKSTPARAREDGDGQLDFPIEQLLPWAEAGVRAVWNYPGDATHAPRRLVGEIVEREADGVLAFSSPSLPYTTPALEHLVGHLEPVTDPPERVDGPDPPERVDVDGGQS